MAQIGFYHAQGDTPAALDALLPPLLQKVLGAGGRALVVCPTEARTQRLDETLWTYAPASFLPHGTLAGELPESQPVLLAGAEQPLPEEALAQRQLVVLCGAEAALSAYLAAQGEKAGQSRLFYFFTAAASDVERARKLYKQLKDVGHQLAYHQQTAQGWQKKA